jgi:hypothetical protein
MLGNTVHAVELVFLLLLLFVVVFAALARKIQIPYPIVLVVAGLVLGFVPGIPTFRSAPTSLLRRSSAVALGCPGESSYRDRPMRCRISAYRGSDRMSLKNGSALRNARLPERCE